MFKDFRKKEQELIKIREQIYKKQEKEIARVYKGISDAIEADIKIKGEEYSEEDLRMLKKEIEIQLKDAKKEVEAIIDKNINKVVASTALMHKSFYRAIDKKYGTKLEKKYIKTSTSIERVAIDKIKSGKIYRDNKKLSKRIWTDNKKQLKDIDRIINEGLKNKTNVYNIAKDLEKYVNPYERKDFKWSKVYPGTSKRVDYNAQRLARTAITHSYQEAYKESVRSNHFIEYIEYNSAHNARTCSMCANRDGKRFKVDDVPLDHPNGNCFLTSVIPDNITDLIADVVNNGKNIN